jgi:hypothetical protein
MSNLVSLLLNIIALPILHPFFYGLLGINLFAVYGLVSFRHNLSVATLLTTFLFSLLSDVALSLNLGTTFLSITIMGMIDQLIRKVIPNENPVIDVLHSFFSFSLFFTSVQILGQFGKGNGFVFFSTFDEFLTVLFASFVMSTLVQIVVGVRSRIVGGVGSSKMIKL